MKELGTTLEAGKVTDNLNSNIMKSESYPIRREESLVKTLDSLILNSRLSDVTFVVQGKEIAAHRFLLAARSSVFEAMFYGSLKSDTKIITITDCSFDVFQTTLMYVYTNEVNINKFNVVGVMITAHKYDLSFLEAKCENFISGCVNLEEMIQYFDVLFGIDAFMTLKKSIIKNIKKKITEERKRDLLLNVSTIETLKNLLEEIVTVRCADASQFYLDLFEMLVVWAKEQCDEDGAETNASTIRASLGGLEQLLDRSTLSREHFAKCQEICPAFFSSAEIKKIYENLTPVTSQKETSQKEVGKRTCNYCSRTMTKHYCCGNQQ